jgi:hypothetical protein
MSVTVPAVTCGLIPGRRFVYELATRFPLSLNLRFAYFTNERVAFTLSELTPFSTTPQLQLYYRSTTPRSSPISARCFQCLFLLSEPKIIPISLQDLQHGSRRTPRRCSGP